MRQEYHDQRRQQVADAVERLVAEHGLESVTIARTAEAAGVSVGLVQHYFGGKDEMLRFAYVRISARILERAERRARALTAHEQPISRILLEGLAERLPLDEGRRAEWRVGFAFLGRSLEHPELARVRSELVVDLRSRLATAIHNGKECGEVVPDTDPRLHADRLLAYSDGLAVHAYTEPAIMTAEAATAALADQLAEVFPGECRQYDKSHSDKSRTGDPAV